MGHAKGSKIRHHIPRSPGSRVGIGKQHERYPWSSVINFVTDGMAPPAGRERNYSEYLVLSNAFGLPVLQIPVAAAAAAAASIFCASGHSETQAGTLATVSTCHVQPRKRKSSTDNTRIGATLCSPSERRAVFCASLPTASYVCGRFSGQDQWTSCSVSTGWRHIAVQRLLWPADTCGITGCISNKPQFGRVRPSSR